MDIVWSLVTGRMDFDLAQMYISYTAISVKVVLEQSGTVKYSLLQIVNKLMTKNLTNRNGSWHSYAQEAYQISSCGATKSHLKVNMQICMPQYSFLVHVNCFPFVHALVCLLFWCFVGDRYPSKPFTFAFDSSAFPSEHLN